MSALVKTSTDTGQLHSIYPVSFHVARLFDKSFLQDKETDLSNSGFITGANLSAVEPKGRDFGSPSPEKLPYVGMLGDASMYSPSDSPDRSSTDSINIRDQLVKVLIAKWTGNTQVKRAPTIPHPYWPGSILQTPVEWDNNMTLWNAILADVALSPANFTGNSDCIDAQKRLVERLFTQWITDTDKAEEISAVLKLLGFDQVADRLNRLQRIAADDATEPSMSIDSLRSLARLLVIKRPVRPPRIGVSPDGTLQIEWRLENRGILAMWFLTDGRIQFAGIEGRNGVGIQPKRVSGTLSEVEMMQAIRPFTVGIFTE